MAAPAHVRQAASVRQTCRADQQARVALHDEGVRAFGIFFTDDEEQERDKRDMTIGCFVFCFPFEALREKARAGATCTRREVATLPRNNIRRACAPASSANSLGSRPLCPKQRAVAAHNCVCTHEPTNAQNRSCDAMADGLAQSISSGDQPDSHGIPTCGTFTGRDATLSMITSLRYPRAPSRVAACLSFLHIGCRPQ